jgi:hypothetical protein
MKQKAALVMEVNDSIEKYVGMSSPTNVTAAISYSLIYNERRRILDRIVVSIRCYSLRDTSQ